jgi:hypothetical protein
LDIVNKAAVNTSVQAPVLYADLHSLGNMSRSDICPCTARSYGAFILVFEDPPH